MDKIDQVKKIAQKLMKTSSSSHGWPHVERVCRLALRIGKEERADIEILQIASWLHDIAREEEFMGKIRCHAETGAERAGKILKELGFPRRKIIRVTEAILTHRYSKKIQAKTKEAKILQDADRLDALGAICIARVFNFGGEHKRPLHTPHIFPAKEYDGSISTSSINHFFEKILKLKPTTFNTDTGKRLAKNRYRFTQKFVEMFLKEWEGKS